ncbi:hypothetical protein EYF80_053356 [Liparis tanakae]|uniref:Uncharacterized protein n=1 Tax=Liparis tanakae TaxID=230148 RepID=A0A4Z2F5U2_9TELE|nr:hypothetical protein EYF80_053356 [Liparis tanakae]
MHTHTTTHTQEVTSNILVFHESHGEEEDLHKGIRKRHFVLNGFLSRCRARLLPLPRPPLPVEALEAEAEAGEEREVVGRVVPIGQAVDFLQLRLADQ